MVLVAGSVVITKRFLMDMDGNRQNIRIYEIM